VFGVLLAFNKSDGLLGGHLLEFLAAHMTIMLAGWVLMTFFGVAYRLIGMFTLAEQHFMTPLAWTEFGLIAAGTWLLALRFALSLPAALGQMAGVMLLGGVACFAFQIVHLYRHRMRRVFDIHSPFALLAAGFALAAAGLLTYGLAAGTAPGKPLWIAIVWLALFGAAETAIQGFFYKIATFLVWLKRYAPIAGTKPVPRLDELYNRRLAVWGWAFWTTGVIATTFAILLEIDALGAAALLLLAGAGCFLVNVVRIGRHWRGSKTAASSQLVIRRVPA
jgi:hypothetical protein